MWSGEKSSDSGVCTEVNGLVAGVTRANEKMIGLILISAENLVNTLSVYVPQVGRKADENDKFWNLHRY